MNTAKESPPVGRFWPKPRKAIAHLMSHKGLPPSASGNPFPYDDAESDSTHLFSKENFFWSEHPLLKRLKQKNEVTVVTGEKGAGKTAFSRAYGKYLIDKYVLSCYFQQPLHFSDIQSAFAERALDFVIDNPFYLPVSPPERKLLAEWFKANIENSIIPAKISRAVFHIKDAEWFKDAGSDSQHEKWHSKAKKNLQDFLDLIEGVPSRYYNPSQARKVFQQCIESLNFKKVRAVFDLGKNLSRDELINLNEFIRLDQGLSEIMLFSRPDSNLINDLECESAFEKLTWSINSSNLLEKMVRYRWAIVSKSDIESLFIKNAFAYLLKCARDNPGNFVRLWNKVLDLKKPTNKISPELINKADQ